MTRQSVSGVLAIVIALVCINQALAQSNPTGNAGKASAAMAKPLTSPTIAGAGKPALVSIDLGTMSTAPAKLEFSVSPETVSSEESYIVSVSPVEKPEDQLGSMAFYPPPRVGEVRKFYINLSPAVLAEHRLDSKIDLSITLVPVDRKEAFAASSMRILGARVIR